MSPTSEPYPLPTAILSTVFHIMTITAIVCNGQIGFQKGLLIRFMNVLAPFQSRIMNHLLRKPKLFYHCLRI